MKILIIFGTRPEEIKMARLHFAATVVRKRNLLNEGFPENNIPITGYTLIDALH